MTERWFAFKAYNTQTLYGFGTEAEADEYCDHLNEARSINHYAAVPLADDALPDHIEDMGFSLSVAIADWDDE